MRMIRFDSHEFCPMSNPDTLLWLNPNHIVSCFEGETESKERVTLILVSSGLIYQFKLSLNEVVTRITA